MHRFQTPVGWLGPAPRVSDCGGSVEVQLRLQSGKCPGDADAVGLGTTLGDLLW